MTEKLCPICEEPVPPNRTRPHVYCSHACRTRAYYARHRVELAARRRAKRAEQEALDD
jgi:predicted nucleic acid-binding Zn ribbon protein